VVACLPSRVRPWVKTLVSLKKKKKERKRKVDPIHEAVNENFYRRIVLHLITDEMTFLARW
jgi:hypothetical protein